MEAQGLFVFCLVESLIYKSKLYSVSWDPLAFRKIVFAGIRIIADFSNLAKVVFFFFFFYFPFYF